MWISQRNNAYFDFPIYFGLNIFLIKLSYPRKIFNCTDGIELESL